MIMLATGFWKTVLAILIAFGILGVAGLVIEIFAALIIGVVLPAIEKRRRKD